MTERKYSAAQARELAREARARFEDGDEPGFFEILDMLTKSKSGLSVLRAFGAELGDAATSSPDKYFVLFDKIMHRPREASYDPLIHDSSTRNIDKNISALVYGGRVAIVGSAFTQMREKHWRRILGIIEAWNIEFADWYVVDSWCRHPMGYIIAEHQNVMISKFRKWSKSENFWFRKAVPVYLHAFFTSYAGYDISPYLDILDSLMLDKENWVAKGMGWCLREMAKNYRKELLRFINKWIKVGNKRANQVIRTQAIKKLDKHTQSKILQRL